MIEAHIKRTVRLKRGCRICLLGLLTMTASTFGEMQAEPGTSRFEIGPEIFRYDYEEPDLMTLKGTMVGIDARWVWTGPRVRTTGQRDALLFGVHGRYAVGEADYDGQLLDEANTPYQVRGIDSTSYELRLLAGYAPQLTDERHTSVWIGFGYRFKDDDSSFDPAGYLRESTYRYFPIIVQHQWTTGDRHRWVMQVEYDLFISGDHVTDLSSIGGPRLSKAQNSGYGVRASLGWIGQSERFEWIVEPFVRYWDIKDSEVVRVTDGRQRFEFFEPANQTWEIGLGGRLIF